MMNMDPFGSLKNMMGKFRGFMQNPAQFMLQNKLNIPQQYMNNPNDALQYLMNTGKLSQEQYDWAMNQASHIQKNPEFMRMLSGMMRQ
jgi:hypothetical protein